MNIDLYAYQLEVDEQTRQWSSEGYSKDPCPKCNRQRLERCSNKKHWCEKCNWVVEDKRYFNPEWRI